MNEQPRRQPPVPAIAPPTLLVKWQTWAIGLAIMLVPFFVPIPRVLGRHPIISPLGDQLHVVLLAGLSLLLYWRGPLKGRLWTVALVATVIGGAIEFIQIPFGRHAHLMDFVLDVVGVGLVVGYVLWRGHGMKVGLGLVIALLMVLPARLYHVPFVAMASYRGQEIFPLISDFEGSRDHWLWDDNGSELSVVDIPDSPLGPGRVIRMAGGPPHRWPGMEMRRFPHDWTAYEYLVFDVRVIGKPDDAKRFSVRLDDFVGRRDHTWISDGYTATTSWQTFRIPLNDRAVTDGKQVQDRRFDRQDVDRILLYLPHPKESAVLEFDNLRLE